MATSTRVQGNNWSDQVVGVLATDEGLRSPRALTLDPAQMQVNGDLGYKWVLPGMLISRLANNLGRIFPAVRATAATTTAQNTLTVKNAAIFKVGDVLRNGFAGSTVGTIQSINTTTNVVTLAANAAVAVAIRDVIVAADAGNVSDVFGLVLSGNEITKNPNDIAAYTSCTVYGNRLMLWTPELQTQFPEITFINPIATANLP